MAKGLGMRNDLIGALACLGAGGYVLWEAQRFSMLGSVFPRAVALVLLAASLLLLTRILLAREPEVEPATGSSLRRLLLVLAALVWVALLRPLGFVPASLIGFGLAVAVANFEAWTPRRAAGLAVVSLALVLAFYLLFAWALRVPLPRGTLIAG